MFRYVVLTFTNLCANSEDDTLMIVFLIFQKTGFDSLHEMSKLVFWEKIKKKIKKK